MNGSFTDAQGRRLRLRSQRLDPRRATDSVEETVRAVCGLQAQDTRAAALAVRARSRELTVEDLEVAQYEDRSVVRTWCHRGTLHLVAVDDLPWLLSLFGPVFVDRGRRRLTDLGFDDTASDRAVEVISDALADHGPSTRTELATDLQRAGFECDPKSQTPYHLVRRAALLGIVCEVATSDGDAVYGLLENWVSLGDPPDRESAVAELARRYLTAYQPATLADFAAWSRLPMRDVRTGWALIDDETSSISVDESTARILSDTLADELTPNTEALRLLPAFDTYLIGYDSREHAVSPADDHRVWPGGGVIRPTVIVDGQAVATWRLDTSRTVASVTVEPFGAFDTGLSPPLEAEIDDLGRFLDIQLEPGFELP